MIARAEPVRTPARPRDRRGLHPGAWLAWLVAASVSVFLTSNPLYLSLGLLAAGGVYLSVANRPSGRALRLVVVFGLALAVLSVPFNVLTGSSGSTVLTTLPDVAFPRSFGGVTFGGAITAEALVTAAGRAIAIATLIVLAAAFNSAVDHARLLRLAPRSFAQMMLVLTIGLFVVPQAVAHARAVAEARRLRGRSTRGLRALPWLLLPVLRGALERSVQRAESLDARGFGAQAHRQGWPASLAAVGGLGLCAWGAFAHFYYGPGLFSGGAMAGGAGLVCMALLYAPGAAARPRPRDSWTLGDQLVAGAALLSLFLLLALRVSGTGDAAYLPYPAVRAPAFHPAGALAFVLLLAPGLTGAPPEAES